MRILYCAPELGGGATATYLRFAADAMRIAGHEIFFLTWHTAADVLPEAPADSVRRVAIAPEAARTAFPAGPPGTALAHLLAPVIAACVDDWDIDVIESVSHAFPAYVFFQTARTSRRYRHLMLATFMSELNIEAYRADLAFPDDATSDDLCSGRQMLRLSDIVIAPSHRAARVARGFGIRTPVAVVPPPFRFHRTEASDRISGRLLQRGPLSLANGLDALAFFVSQMSEVIGLTEVYLLGADGGTSLREDRALDLFTRRLKPLSELRVIATGALSDADALDLVHAADLVAEFGEGNAFAYFPLQALERGAFPLSLAGASFAESLPPDLADLILPRDVSDRTALRRACGRLLSNKRALTERVQGHVAAVHDPRTYAARMEAVYGAQERDRSPRRRGADAGAVSPTIAVLTAAHDPDPSLRDMLACLARQTRRPDRLYLCDDGSTAGLSPWIAEARDLGLDVTPLVQPHQGLSGARNTLIDACDCDLALFLDCDDRLADHAIERLLEAWQAAGEPDAVIPQRENFGESREVVIRHLLHDHLHLLRNEYRMTALIKTAALHEIGFDAMRRNGEADDWLFWLAFSARGLRAEFVPESLFFYHFYAGSMSWPWSMGQAAGTAAAIARHAAVSTRETDLAGWAQYELHGSLFHRSAR